MYKLIFPAALAVTLAVPFVVTQAQESPGFQRKSFEFSITSPSFEEADKDQDKYLTREEFDQAIGEVRVEVQPFKQQTPGTLIKETAPTGTEAEKPAPEAEPTPFKRKVPETDIK